MSQIQFRESFVSDKVNDFRVSRDSEVKYNVIFLIEVVLGVAPYSTGENTRSRQKAFC